MMLAALRHAGGEAVHAAPPLVPQTAPAGERAAGVAGEGREGHPLRVLAGAAFSLPVAAPSGRVAVWRLAYGADVVAAGRLELDAGGGAVLRLVAPDVRTRVLCTLRLDAGDFAASQEVIVLPASRLMVAAERLKRLRLGVSDPSGRVQAALTAEGAAFENLETDAQELFFDGGAVILAGRGRTQELAAACEQFRHRLRGGMTVLVLNPPAGWAAEGVRRVELALPQTGPAWASKALHDLPLPDMGSGPWASALAADKAQMLLWAGGAAEGAVRPGEACGLALWRPVGEGRMAAALLPALADPAADAVGRCILDELVLWVLEAQLPHRQGEQHLN